MDTIRTGFPQLVAHEGEWAGTYTELDLQGNILDTWQSHLICSFPEDPNSPWAYEQWNHYTWADGKKEELYFPATYENGRILWDTDRISGYACGFDHKTVMLYWKRKDIENSYLYEMIQLSDDRTHRARIWHWFVDDRMVKRTIINETRIK
jgi:hypothetical protein